MPIVTWNVLLAGSGVFENLSMLIQLQDSLMQVHTKAFFNQLTNINADEIAFHCWNVQDIFDHCLVAILSPDQNVSSDFCLYNPIVSKPYLAFPNFIKVFNHSL